ncbi:MAG: NifU family protein [Rhodocyclaceae bacterium]|nr:NifU family protein [Rhodocyclaceae bacterium]MBX3668032.1 NifU family protein [Rhodocyclaceae bacterium]
MNASDNAAALQRIAETSAADLERLVQSITRLENIVSGWDESKVLAVHALKSAIEELHKEALARLIRALKDDPASAAHLRAALADQVVYGVLRFHGLVKEPLQARLQAALDEVRPYLQSHHGDVELVAITAPDSVEIRLTGACHGCPSSSQTLVLGVEQAIRKHCPDIEHIRQVSLALPEAAIAGSAPVHFVSPFAAAGGSTWRDIASLADIPDGGVLECRLDGKSLLLARRGVRVSCFDNACAHLGMPLDMGEIENGVITCSYHGFRYLLETGECLTAPEVQLRVHPVRVVAGRAEVQLQD